MYTTSFLLRLASVSGGTAVAATESSVLPSSSLSFWTVVVDIDAEGVDDGAEVDEEEVDVSWFSVDIGIASLIANAAIIAKPINCNKNVIVLIFPQINIKND